MSDYIDTSYDITVLAISAYEKVWGSDNWYRLVNDRLSNLKIVVVFDMRFVGSRQPLWGRYERYIRFQLI